MNNRTVKIVFKDNTSTTFKDKDIWLRDITDGIEHAMALKLPYILNSEDDQNNYYDALIIPTENIKYIRIIDTPEVKKEHEDEKQD